MGSMIYLAVGRLEVCWGKNSGFVDHSALFQAGDLSQVPYYYKGKENAVPNGEPDWEVITELKDGLSKPLWQVIDRINLLGHTRAVCEHEFASLAPNYGEGGEDFGKFFRREILPRLKLKGGGPDPMGLSGISEGMENLTSYTILHLLADNPSARALNVQWAFNDVEDGGWARREDFVRPLDQTHRFLLVTEGSSDAAMLRKAFALLRPHIADFFDFVDMEEGYPFSGTGNVYRFIQGLISIRVLNSVIVIYDNDAEGRANYDRTLELNVPSNMAVLKLPDREEFAHFPTKGPEGDGEADINGRAAAIECFLDLPSEARVRWSSHNAKADAYQGELIDKERYAREFLRQLTRVEGYDYSKLEALLDHIVSTAIAMREPRAIEEFERMGIGV
jgi:hypothetical protein